MLAEVSIVVAFIFITISFSYLFHVLECRYYPPGVFPIPIIGSFEVLANEPWKKFQHLSKKYGDVFSISSGTQRIVIANSYESIYEVLASKGREFSGRPIEYTSMLFTNGQLNLSHTDNGPFTAAVRKIYHGILKTSAKKNDKNIDIITRESINLHACLKNSNGYIKNFKGYLDFCTTNIITSIAFNYRFAKATSVFNEITRGTRLLLKNSCNTDISNFSFYTKFLPLKKWKEITSAKRAWLPWIDSTIQDRFNDSLHLENVISSIHKLSDDSGKAIDKNQLSAMFIELIMAGCETTSATISWFIIYLAHRPHYQQLLFDEMTKEFGDGYPDSNDREKLPLMEAALHETLRLSSVVPLNLSHKALKDTSLLGMSVRKNTIVLTNLWGIHHNEKYWNNPDEFKLMRWIDEEGNFIKTKQKYLFTFSRGPRVCVGESLARVQLFILCSRLIKDFFFKLPENVHEEIVSSGVTNTPEIFDVIITNR